MGFQYSNFLMFTASHKCCRICLCYTRGMSFLSDLGSFIGDVNEFKDEIKSTFQGVSDDVTNLKDEASEEGAKLVEEVKQAGEDITKNL